MYCFLLYCSVVLEGGRAVHDLPAVEEWGPPVLLHLLNGGLFCVADPSREGKVVDPSTISLQEMGGTFVALCRYSGLFNPKVAAPSDKVPAGEKRAACCVVSFLVWYFAYLRVEDLS